MGTLLKTWRIFYGIMVIGLALQQFYYGDFRPVVLPAWPSWMPSFHFWVLVCSGIMLIAGWAIIFGIKAIEAALFLGTLFLAFFCFCQIPFQIRDNPAWLQPGSWTSALKGLTISGGAFLVAGSLIRGAAPKPGWPALSRILEKIIPWGKIFFSVTLITFGIDHFLYTSFVMTLVPAWIPGPLFWTYFAGIALIGAGTGIILPFTRRTVAFLAGLMIFIWLMVLHIPRAIADPHSGQGNEVSSVLEALGFSGIAFLIAFGKTGPDPGVQPE